MERISSEEVSDLTKSEVKDKIQDLSNKIHQSTMRGGAELILLSKRAYQAIEEDIVFNEYLNRFMVMNPSEWEDPPMAPCDIRAIYFGGMLEYKVEEEKDSETEVKDKGNYVKLDIPEINMEYKDEGVSNSVEEHTFQK